MSKTDVRKTIFKCDFETCDNQFVLDETKIMKNFYEAGWIYLYSLAWKTDLRVERGRSDKHFCSQDHLILFITAELQKTVVTEEGDNLCPPICEGEASSEGFLQ